MLQKLVALIKLESYISVTFYYTKVVYNYNFLVIQINFFLIKLFNERPKTNRLENQVPSKPVISILLISLVCLAPASNKSSITCGVGKVVIM